jgi:hypothetical protein
VVEDKIDSFNELLKEAESTLIEIKTHEKKAKKYEEGVDSFCQFNIPLSNWHHSSQ